ncbi:hypothetical protein ACFXOD_33350 [Streptomyces sp. NPDC059161]|uniref:hypothetical protein n=1 Tax=Streptomyces sp. NPDC059161 TaxID=3346749 RepID=UPI0036BAF4D6
MLGETVEALAAKADIKAQAKADGRRRDGTGRHVAARAAQQPSGESLGWGEKTASRYRWRRSRRRA